MPEFKLPTAKFPDLREMRADDIRHAIAEVPRPDIHLSDIADAASTATQAAAKAATAATTKAASATDHLPIRRKRSSRRPMAIAGLLIAVLGIIAVANAGWIRTRLNEMAQRARERMEAQRVSGSLEHLSDEEGYTGSVGIPIEPDTYAESLPSAMGAEPQPVTAEAGAFDANAPYGDAAYEAPHDNGQRSEDEVRLYGS